MKARNILIATASLLLLLNGCARTGSQLVAGSEPAMRWQKLAAAPSEGKSGLISGSLRFGPADDTRRVTYMLRDTDSNDPGRPVRLQVSAGIGAVIAEAFFKDGRMLVVLPQDGKAYSGADTPENISRILGMPLPMRMNELAGYLRGKYASALGNPVPDGFDIAKDGVLYHCGPSGFARDITLDGAGRPVHVSRKGSWEMSTTYDESSGLPKRLDGTLNTAQGPARLVLLVKERSASPAGGPGMSISVPENFPIYDIDRPLGGSGLAQQAQE